MKAHLSISSAFVVLPACTLALLISALCHAGIEQGYEAFDRGDVATAIKIWRALAEQGAPSVRAAGSVQIAAASGQ